MRTLTTLGTALGLALLLHAPAWAQTLGELSAAQGVASSVSAAEASSATTARNVRDSLTSHLSSSSLSSSGLSSSGGKRVWADGGHVLVDRRLERLVLEALIELGRVEAHVLRVLLQLVLAERGLISEQSGVILPELALRVGAARGLGGRTCLRVHGEREVAVDEPHLVAVVLHHLLDGALAPPADRALVVRQLDDGDRRLGAAAALRAAGGGDLDHGRTQLHRHLVRLLELLDEGLAPPLNALLRQVLDDARLHLLERLATELRLVGVV